MRLPLQLISLGSALAVMWIAFAHRITVPASAVTIDSMAVPLAVLCGCAAGYAWSYRAALREALQRAVDGTPNRTDERAAQITVGVLVVVGFLLRIARTGDYGLNPDEAQLVWLAAAPTPGEVWSYETSISPHPPAIFFMFHYMMKLSWDLVWLRLPAVLGGTFSIWMSYRLGRELLNAPTGVAMAWLVTFSPPIFELSRVARNYAPGFAFVVLALFLFVRFLKTQRWRYFAWYTAVATIAVTWHYAFVVAFISMKLVLAIEFLRRRAPVSSWMAAGILQLPFAAVMIFLYLEHIAVLPPLLVSMHQHWYGGMLDFDPAATLSPFAAIWRLLAPGGTRTALMILSATGVVVLVARRQWMPLAFCTVPLLVATGFAWSGRIPLGASRHSIYLFPFLFALAACHLSEILTGYRTTRSGIAGLGRGMGWLDPGNSSSIRGAAWGSAAACVLAALFAAGSLLDYNLERVRNRGLEATSSQAWSPFASDSYHGVELVRSYPQANVERAFELLEEYAGPNDWVLLDFPSAYALRLYLELPPVVFDDEMDRKKRDISMIALNDRRPTRHRHNGVQYYHSNAFMNPSELAEIMRMIRDVRRFYDVALPRKVWLIRGAWSPPLADRFKLKRSGLRVDWRAYHESRGLLLGIDTNQLRTVLRRAASTRRSAVGKPPTRGVPSKQEPGGSRN